MIDGKNQLLESLRRARRRIVWTRMVELSGLGLLVWLIGLSAHFAMSGGSTERSLWIGAAGFFVAVITPLLVGTVTAPTLQGTARLLDRCLSLDERIESAFDAARSDSAVAALLRNDAQVHLGGIDLRSLFPYRFRFLGARLWLALLILAAVSLALRWLIMPEVWLPANVSSAVGRGAADFPGPAGKQERSEEDPMLRIAESRGPERGATGESGTREQLATVGSLEMTQPAKGTDAAQKASPRPRPTAAAGTGESEASRGQRKSSVGAVGREQSRQEKGGAEAGDAVLRLSAAVSIEGTQSLSTSGADSPAEGEALSSRVAASDGVDWQGIESALRREHLPPGLERYVRDYFLAISRSGDQP